MAEVYILMAGSNLGHIEDWIGDHLVQEFDLSILPHLHLSIRILLDASAFDQVVDPRVMREVGVWLGASDDNRIGVIEAGEVHIGVGTPGDVDDDGIRILANQGVHTGMIHRIELNVDADFG